MTLRQERYIWEKSLRCEMKVEIKKLDSCKRQLNIEVDREKVKQKFDEVYNRIGKEIRIKGFRTGKAPRHILERDYKDLASQEVLKELIPQVCKEVIEENRLSIIDLPQISDIHIDRESLIFKASCEVKPEIKIDGYRNIKVNYKKIEVSGDEIKKVIQALKEERKEENLTDEFAHRFGCSDLRELEEMIQAQIYLERHNLQRQSLEEQIIQNLLKLTSFPPPSSLVDRRLNELVEREKIDLALRGIREDEIKKRESELREKLKDTAEKQVRVFLILEKIAQEENFILDENMPRNVMEFLLSQAVWEVKT